MAGKKTKQILIAEDERPMAKALQLKLKGSGFEAEIASHGDEAWELIKNKKFDILLLDIMLPGKDGFSILLNMNKEKIKIPTFILSNLSQENDIKKAKELGALDFFIKSDTPLVKIIEKVKEVLSK